MSFIKEFKEFAVKGNMVDMAVGIIVGTAFNKVVNTLVSQIFLPPLGKLIGGVNFSNLYINLSETQYATLDEATKAGAPVIGYGAFIQSLIDFTIMAFVVFLVVKGINYMKKKEAAIPAPAPAVPEDIKLLAEIRDLLKK